MSKIKYQNLNFTKKSLEKIAIASKIIAEYMSEGYELTLRQLYYQFVARDYIPNTQREYAKLGSLISKARMAGLIDWKSITDRTRKVESVSHWSDPESIIETCAEQYAIDTRATQKNYVEVWVEKDALASILERACEPLDVAYFSCRGYASLSSMWRASLRFREKESEGKKTYVLHLGDHDPSGLDMTRVIQEHLRIFECDTYVKRIALTMEQISEHSPPPNPAKVTDSRYDGYEAEYGDDSWELDALDPKVLDALIVSEVKKLTDKKARDKLIQQQADQREQIQYIADNYNEIVDGAL